MLIYDTPSQDHPQLPRMLCVCTQIINRQFVFILLDIKDFKSSATEGRSFSNVAFDYSSCYILSRIVSYIHRLPPCKRKHPNSATTPNSRMINTLLIKYHNKSIYNCQKYITIYLQK